jgi:uncharacterized protein (PEP-CTERM system associated)
VARTSTCLIGGVVAAFLAQTGAALAFPFVDPSNSDSLPSGAPLGTELPSSDVQGLQSQLRLTNPLAPGNQSAWTIVPRLTMQEMITDNAFEVSSPRSFDALTVIAPGISILANTARLQLNLDYAPNLFLHAINGPLNVLTQQLTATGLITVVPDLAYVDVRALSGVQSQLGALAGAGSLGANGSASSAPASGGVPGVGDGLNRNNEVQTSSFGISPYLLRQFGDYGSGKVGVSANASRSTNISGFASLPIPEGGSSGQSLLSTEEIAHYTTGQFLSRIQYSLDIDASQSRTQAIAGTETVGSVTVSNPGGTFTSQREAFTNGLSYALNRNFTLLASVGDQQIRYTGNVAPPISGLTWNVGVTVTPDPNSSMTITYGHQYGTDAFQANGYLAVGGLSSLTFSYSNTVGTQLENLQNQLNAAAVSPAGQLVSALNGGQALVATNALGVENGVFRFSTLTASWQTQWLRDMLQATLSWSIQTTLTPSLALLNSSVVTLNGQPTPFTVVNNQLVLNTVLATTVGSTDLKTATVGWTHQLSPDLVSNANVSYSFIRRSGGIDDSSFAAGIGLQYTLSQATTLTARYSFFDRISKIPGYSLYDNILILGFTKQF